MPLTPTTRTKILETAAVGLALAVYIVFLLKPVNLVTADLGRHIKNGESILANWAIPRTNLYSYTNADYPVIIHHWLSGVVFFLIWKAAGFAGLHVFFLIANAAAFLIFFRIAQKRAGAALTALTAILIIPLLLERDEIRPEIFSYLFSAVFFWLMIRWREGKVSNRAVFITLTLLEIIWVNTHIYFFVGPAIAAAFFLEGLIQKSAETTKKLGLLLVLTAAAALLNPFGTAGVLAPLSIFSNYGYRLAENQTVWFIEKLLPNPNYFIFKLAFDVLVASFLIRLAAPKTNGGWPWSDTLLAAGVSAGGWLAIRNLALFGLFALPVTAGNLSMILSRVSAGRTFRIAAAIVPGLLFLTVLSGEIKTIYPRAESVGVGLEKGNSAAAEFIKKNNLAGPIFNNYDIGGYLIFHLWPQEKVFVDNRPEAYPKEFFEKTYVPMQEDEKIWSEQLQKYGFKTIVFSRRDYTPWGQEFLAQRLTDPEWSAVFRDGRVIVFRRTKP